MAFVVEKDVSFDPIQIDIFGVDGIMLSLENFVHLVEEFFGRLFVLHYLFA